MKFFNRASGRSQVLFENYERKINLLNTGGSCSRIKIQIKKKKEITMSKIH